MILINDEKVSASGNRTNAQAEVQMKPIGNVDLIKWLWVVLSVTQWRGHIRCNGAVRSTTSYLYFLCVCNFFFEAEINSNRLKAQGSMMAAVACASVPKITVVIGGCHGADSYTMVRDLVNSKNPWNEKYIFPVLILCLCVNYSCISCYMKNICLKKSFLYFFFFVTQLALGAFLIIFFVHSSCFHPHFKKSFRWFSEVSSFKLNFSNWWIKKRFCSLIWRDSQVIRY